jgi:L-amino acid N-acyltransferase YncA
VTLIRDAGRDDVPAITVIANALIATTTYEWTERLHTEADRAAWLDHKRERGFPVLVACDDDADGAVVGFACYDEFRDVTRWPGYRPTVEHSIHVRRSHWGRGIGKALLDALVERARAAGHRVHTRLGFVEVGRLPEVGEKFGRRLDLVLLQRAL